MPNAPQRLDQVFQKYEPPLYFVTFNGYRRRRILAHQAIHSAFVEFATRANAKGIIVGRYVLMPDHVHLFVRESDGNKLSQWIRSLKRALSPVIDASRPHWQPVSSIT